MQIAGELKKPLRFYGSGFALKSKLKMLISCIFVANEDEMGEFIGH
jgi:hypothetical protein